MQDKLKAFLKQVKLNESLLSMILGVVTIVVVAFLVFNFYTQNSKTDIAETGESTETMEKIGEVPVVTEEDGKKYPAELAGTYTVKAGDHLWGIAEDNYGSGYNWVDIAKENGLKNASFLAVGQELKLPKVAVRVVEVADPASTLKPGQTVIEGDSYTVVKDDTLWDIAVRAYQDGYRWPEIARENGVVDPNYIEVGQVLKLKR